MSAMNFMRRPVCIIRPMHARGRIESEEIQSKLKNGPALTLARTDTEQGETQHV